MAEGVLGRAAVEGAVFGGQQETVITAAVGSPQSEDRWKSSLWVQGRVSGPDEMVAVARGVRELCVNRVSKRILT